MSNILFIILYCPHAHGFYHIFRVDLLQLVEEAVDGGWIGHLARMSAQNSEIGSVYSPPTVQQQSDNDSRPTPGGYVETIIEIGHREKVC